MANLGGPRAQFTCALNEYNKSEDPDTRDGEVYRRRASNLPRPACAGLSGENFAAEQGKKSAE
jgi:hypothetical protein